MPRACLLLCLVAIVGACEGNPAAPRPVADATHLYWALRLDHRAVTLSTTAPYDTLTVLATPVMADGQPLGGLPAPRYESTDPERIQVTPEGVLRAVAPGSEIVVVATLSAGNLTHADTVVVNAVDDPEPPVLATFSAQPVPPDSAKLAVNGGGIRSLPIQALDREGNPMEVAVFFSSSDSTTAAIDRTTGRILPARVGDLTFYATATAFGITMADTVPFRIGLATRGTIEIQRVSAGSGTPVANAFLPLEIRVGVGATIIWNNVTGMETDIAFDDPTIVADPAVCGPFVGFTPGPCGSGNIEPFGLLPGNAACFPFMPGCAVARAFPLPGTYPYRSTLHGTSARIVVVDER